MTAAPGGAKISGRFFVPGPTEVHPDVLDAMRRPMIPFFGSAMEQLLGGLQPPLRRLFRTRESVLVAACSATGFMEAAIRCAVPRRLLAVISGYFGERFAQVAEACGREVVRVHVQPGRSIEPAHLARFLDGPRIDAVAMVHAETSTGALAPLAELSRVVHEREDVLLLVDAVTSVGGSPVETDRWELDFVFTATQKALALPPGLALGVASPRLIDRARRTGGRGWYLDLLKYDETARSSRPPQTPAISLLYALERQLTRIDAEGLETRWKRHEAMRTMVEEWAAHRPGHEILAPPGRRAATVTAIRTPTRAARGVVAAAAARGWFLGAGLDPLVDAVVRIGHMGEVQPEHLAELLADLTPLLDVGEHRPV